MEIKEAESKVKELTEKAEKAFESYHRAAGKWRALVQERCDAIDDLMLVRARLRESEDE